ncbi:hypothetical protein ACE6H2_017289 [Prunus campanulata]
MGIFSKKQQSGFSASSTAEEVTEGIDGTGLTAIVTGASSGIGVETARVLALRGVHVVLAVRNTDAGANVKEAILKEIPNAKIYVRELDLSSFTSVRKFAADYHSSGLPLNILIYSRHSAYAQSKLANILHANELTRRLKEEGAEVTANSLHPGTIVTNLLRYDGFLKCKLHLLYHMDTSPFTLLTVQQYFSGFPHINSHFLWLDTGILKGAATTCFVALHPQVKGVGGEYFVDCNIAKPSSQAKDADLATRL